MPIRVQDELPAVNFLRNENVFVMTTTRATTQEIRPLKVLILNLMPKKIETENQFLRLLSNSPLQVDIQLLRIDARESRNTPAEHLNNFYCNFDEICDQNFDGLIVTGAPLGLVEFNDVAYWPQIKQVLEWAKDHVTSTLFVCWAVQAALNILYGIPKQTRAEKISGVYEHHILHPHALLTRGFDDSFRPRTHAMLIFRPDLSAIIPILRSSRRRKRAMRICLPVKISASPLSPATRSTMPIPWQVNISAMWKPV